MTTTLSVLIVDDDPALLQALPQVLRLRMGGVTVETADSAGAALDRIIAWDYDAVVTDIKMPGMDGLALLAEIRTRRPDTPTLIITGHGENELVVGALRGGACDFIHKPIDRDYLVTALQRAMATREASRRVKEQQLALEHHLDTLEVVVQRPGLCCCVRCRCDSGSRSEARSRSRCRCGSSPPPMCRSSARCGPAGSGRMSTIA